MIALTLNTELALGYAKARQWPECIIALKAALKDANKAKLKRHAGKLIRAIQCAKRAACASYGPTMPKAI